MNKVKSILGKVSAGLVVAGTVASVALAQATIPSQPGNVPGVVSDVPQLITLIYNVIIAAAAAIFVVLLVVGGAQYLGSAGNEENTGKAKRLMIDAVVGLLIVLAAWAIGQWVLNKFFDNDLSNLQ